MLKKAQHMFIRNLLVLTTLLLTSAGIAQAGEPTDPVVNALPNGVAMDGFDVVAYFVSGEPKLGEKANSVEYKGKTWRFSSAENAEKFSANPEKYEPRNNGWCSYAVSEGYSAEVDFVNGWAIIDGKLYLNWNEETRDAFVENKDKRVPLAEEKWSSVHQGLKDGSQEVFTHAGEGVDISHPQQPN